MADAISLAGGITPSDAVFDRLETTVAPVYVQAGPGSFNDEAFGILKQADPAFRRVNPVFAGTPTEAMRMATQGAASGLVFVAVRNNLVGLVNPTVSGIQQFEILRVVSGIEMGVRMCVLVPKQVKSVQALTQVASIQPALDQVAQWRARQGVTTIEEPKGTSEAARKLSSGAYPPHTGVIGPRKLAQIYKGLKPLACGIEDRPSRTEFALIEVQPRETDIPQDQARAELEARVQQLISSRKPTKK